VISLETYFPWSSSWWGLS